MPKVIEYLPGAGDDFSASFDWYANNSQKAAHGFVIAVDNALIELLAQPGRFPPTLCGCRHLALKRYPFRIVFRDEPERVVIVAIAHEKRQPGYWSERL